MPRQVARRAANLTYTMAKQSLEAKAALAKQGLQLPRRPEDEPPSVPKDLTDLDDSALMTLFVQLTQWETYLGVQLAIAEVDEKYAVAVLDKYRALNAIANKSEKTVTAAKARAYEDPEFETAHDENMRCYAYRKLVNALYEDVDRSAALVSRELTRRVGRADRDNRSSRFST